MSCQRCGTVVSPIWETEKKFLREASFVDLETLNLAMIPGLDDETIEIISWKFPFIEEVIVNNSPSSRINAGVFLNQSGAKPLFPNLSRIIVTLSQDTTEEEKNLVKNSFPKYVIAHVSIRK